MLNGDEIPRGRIHEPSPLSTYSVSRTGTDPERFLVLALEPTRSNPGMFSNVGGVLASTPHEDIARDVAEMLNRLDPRERPRTTRGFGWF
jgi:hypothetical protein